MLACETPLDAYRSDLARNAHREDFGPADSVWLLTAHCLSRLTRAPVEDRGVIATQSAAALADFVNPAASGESLKEEEARDLSLILDGLRYLTDRAAVDGLSRGVRGMASRMASAGAHSSAYSILAFARQAAACASDRERGLLTADQAKIARLLGDLETAEELYEVCAGIAERSTDFALLARASIGQGVINRVRGNYPRARVFFERGLELADTARAGELALLAHQGLMICFAIGHDFDRALKHGWEAFRSAEAHGHREVEALGNLAQLCLDAGYPRAALQGFAAVLERSRELRVALSVLGGAAVAAARSGEADVVHRAAAEAERRILHSALAYENAQTLLHLATAYAVLGDSDRSASYLARARRIAKARGFFELLHACDSGKLARTAQEAVAARKLSEVSERVVASLTSMDVGDTAKVLALSS